MIKYLFLIILTFLLTIVTSYAQVGIGTNTPNANAALELVSTSQGMLFPRMTTTQRDAIASPAKGLTIFNSTLNCIQTNIGTSSEANWKSLGISPSSNGTAIVSAYSCATASAGGLVVGSAASGVTQTITANVTTVGTYSISTTANEVTFAASGTFAGSGAQNIVLTATGTPTAAGSNTFTLNTTPNCNFSRITSAPLPANITLSAINPYFVASVYDQDYLPYSDPTEAASLATAQAANGINETTTLNIQGSLTTTGVTIQIPYTVVTSSVTLPAYTQTINVPASITEDGVARDVTFSYPGATLAVGSGTINATLKAVGGTFNAKKLDLQTGIGNDALGWMLAQFTYSTNNSGGTANFQFRSIAPIPDRNINDAAHRMFYVPVIGSDNKIWLNNNLGADYSNMTKSSFNPVQQATSSTDWNAYGSLFQWGRSANGHELITWSGPSSGSATISPNATAQSSSDAPGNQFIQGFSDWRNPPNVNLWQGESGTNNPCPIRYRLPTDTELNTQRASWRSGNNSTGAFATPLKLPMAGRKSGLVGNQNYVGTNGRYWGSTVSSTISIRLHYSSSEAGNFNTDRADGLSVRCIYAGNPSSNGTAAVSGYTCSTASAGTMTAGSTVSGVTQTITATVTTAGTYSISTTANEVTFSGSGTFAGTGAQNIVLTATGTPTAAGSNSFTLDTSPNCSFNRTTALAPLPANITLSAIGAYFVASVYDQDYLPYSDPTEAASLATAQAANGINETTTLNIQGSLTTTGVTIQIPYTVVTSSVTLPAYTQTINVPASITEDGVARDVTFSYPGATLAVGSGTINATLKAVGGTFNAKKLDLQTGIGNDALGWMLAQFTYSTNNSGGTANFQFRSIAPIPDRNINDAAHRMFYVPVIGSDNKIWLNNNLGADYSNMTKSSFNPVQQATSSTDQNAYGSLFQWGRGADGHELINWITTTSGTPVNASTPGPSTSTTPGISFLQGGSNWYTGTSPTSASLWQGVNGTNNPCPIGYRLPTETELNNQRLSWSADTSAGALSSPLKLPLGTKRTNTNGLSGFGSNGYYWSSKAYGSNSRFLTFHNFGANINTDIRVNGLSVRCIKD